MNDKVEIITNIYPDDPGFTVVKTTKFFRDNRGFLHTKTHNQFFNSYEAALKRAV